MLCEASLIHTQLTCNPLLPPAPSVPALRSFKTNPIYSSDSHGADKHKFERFLHPGVHCVAAAFAPISYAPLPLLAFKLQPDGKPAILAASGSLRGCDPDRVVLKKIVLTGGLCLLSVSPTMH